MLNNNGLRVLKNTLSLYLRTILLTFISLFTVRIVLGVLGASDYGLYTLVGGVITMFSFVTNSLSISSQRYYAIHLASDDWNGVSKMFSINMVIYLGFIVIVIALAETVGLWFVLHRLNYEINRTVAALIIYEISIISFVLSILVSPFLALLIADENLSLYSFVSIVEGILKALIVYLLYIIKGDKLIIYAILVAIATVFIDAIYLVYVKHKYRKLKFILCKDISEYKKVFSYLNWNLIGSLASVCKGQGINIIINIFFGTTINAARGVASQINGVIVSFSQNFMKAVDPQITKAYAVNHDERFFKLIRIASKMSFSLLLLFSMPIIFNSDYILTLWLEDVPEYTSLFTSLVLVDAMIASLTDPILTGVQATGKVKLYQIIIGGINLLNLPVSYLFLKIIKNPMVPFAIAIFISFLMGFGRMIVFKRIYHFDIKRYILDVVLPIFIIVILSSSIMNYAMGHAVSFVEFLIKALGSVIINTLLIVIIGLNSDERKIFFSFIHEKVIRIKNH